MSKKNYQTVNGIKIYPVEYLNSNELSESELNNLLDNNGKGLLYSLIIGMFRLVDIKKKNNEIVKLLSKPLWMDDFIWNKNQFNDYENIVKNIYKNIYSYKDNIALIKAQWFMTMYGFKVK